MSRSIKGPLLLPALLAITIGGCNPTPAEKLEMEHLRQDSIAAAMEQERLDSIAESARMDTEKTWANTLLVDTSTTTSFDSLMQGSDTMVIVPMDSAAIQQ